MSKTTLTLMDGDTLEVKHEVTTRLEQPGEEYEYVKMVLTLRLERDGDRFTLETIHAGESSIPCRFEFNERGV